MTQKNQIILLLIIVFSLSLAICYNTLTQTNKIVVKIENSKISIFHETPIYYALTNKGRFFINGKDNYLLNSTLHTKINNHRGQYCIFYTNESFLNNTEVHEVDSCQPDNFQIH